MNDFGIETSKPEEEDVGSTEQDENIDFDMLFNEIEKASNNCDELVLQALLNKAYSFGDEFPFDLSEAECKLASLIDLSDH